MGAERPSAQARQLPWATCCNPLLQGIGSAGAVESHQAARATASWTPVLTTHHAALQPHFRTPPIPNLCWSTQSLARDSTDTRTSSGGAIRPACACN